jgi:ribosomal protein S18 acetylase RimI-like enzyme
MRQDDLTREDEALGAIREVASPRDVALARALFLEYARWLDVDLCFQDFERELAELPGAYAPPRGRLMLAGPPDEAFGCVALRPLGTACGCGPASRGEEGIGEVKRLYVRQARRGQGWGERLARAVVREARGIGYRELKLDTLSWMREARALYGRLGFRECAPYYDNPLDGVVYMSLALAPGSERAA